MWPHVDLFLLNCFLPTAIRLLDKAVECAARSSLISIFLKGPQNLFENHHQPQWFVRVGNYFAWFKLGSILLCLLRSFVYLPEHPLWLIFLDTSVRWCKYGGPAAALSWQLWYCFGNCFFLHETVSIFNFPLSKSFCNRGQK